MSELSKHFLVNTSQRTCAFFLHPNETCTQQFIDMVWRNFFTAGQFYLPTLVIFLVLKSKSLNWGLFIQTLIEYGQCILIGNWCSTVAIGSVCWFTKIFGFNYPWFINVPSFMGTLLFNYYPEKIKRWQTTGLLNMYIESMIRKSNLPIIGYLRKSHIFSTLMFMGFSAVVMMGIQITGVKRFWFASMPTLESDKDKSSKMTKPCNHDGSCTHYNWKEFSKTFKLAMIIGFLKFIVSNYRRIKIAQPTAAIKILLQKLDYNMIAFTLSYNTLFNLLYCWFNNTTGENTARNTFAAGFLSGITYSLYPIYMIFTYGLTATFQHGWLMLTQRTANRPHDSKYTKMLRRFIDFVNKLPISTITMSFCTIKLLQYRIRYPYATPIYVHKMMSLGTAQRVDLLSLRASEIMLGII